MRYLYGESAALSAETGISDKHPQMKAAVYVCYEQAQKALNYVAWGYIAAAN